LHHETKLIILQVKFNNTQAAFFFTLRNRVNEYFKTTQKKSTGDFRLYLKTITIFAALVALYVWLVFLTPDNLWLGLGLSAITGFVMALIGFNVMHDGSHGSYSSKGKLNAAMAYSINILGANAFFWAQKHNINHHTYTNIEGIDDDIDVRPFFRIHSNQKKSWFHRYQHIYWPFLYGLTYLFWAYYRDFNKYITRKIADHTPMQKITLKEHLIFWASKIVHVGIFVVLPALLIGWGKTLLGYGVAILVLGFTLAIVFQLAHVVEDIEFITPTNSDKVDIESDWAVHQMNTTANFATKSKVLSWLLGGLNFQVEHHLFPRVSHVHYPQLNKILKQTCKEFNIHYREFPNMLSAVKSHVLHLKHIGQAV